MKSQSINRAPVSRRAVAMRQPAWINTRQLDLVLLAGCSCLLTLMVQPMATAMTGSSSPHPSLMAYPTQVNGLSCIVAYHAKQVQQADFFKLQK
ncbi:hypothetical protein ACN4EG_10455 [Alkalinema pantanalense CENA528]|uniref:hypothetical protein n=1 Tax=Alkalinema pantanalense TaxID=1620705 RepID=UPI003D6DC68E